MVEGPETLNGAKSTVRGSTVERALLYVSHIAVHVYVALWTSSIFMSLAGVSLFLFYEKSAVATLAQSVF